MAPVAGYRRKGSSHIGNALSYQFGIGVVFVTDNTVGYGGGQQGLYRSQYGNRDGNGKQVFNRFPVQRGHYGIGQFGFDAETVADSVDAVDAAIHLHQVHGYGHYDNGDERAWNFLRKFRSDGNDNDAGDADNRIPPVDGIEMTEINQPFPDEVSRNFLSAEIQSEYIRNLGGEDSNGDTACKAYDNRIGDKLNDCPSLNTPRRMRMTPAISVATISPASPYCWIMP